MGSKLEVLSRFLIIIGTYTAGAMNISFLKKEEDVLAIQVSNCLHDYYISMCNCIFIKKSLGTCINILCTYFYMRYIYE